MKPTNKKEYNRSIWGFFAMWALTTALIVFACLQPFKTPKLENVKLRKQVENLKADSLQQHLLYKTIGGIDSTMNSLEEAVKPNTLKKLRSYPSTGFADTKMKEELASISEKIANLYQQSTTNNSDVARRLQDCESKLDISERDLQSQKDEVQRLLRENNNLKAQIYQ